MGVIAMLVRKNGRLSVKRLIFLIGVSALPLPALYADTPAHGIVRSPAHGVLCDRYMCADGKGVSRSLTTKYLGEKAASTLFSQGDFNLEAFTFANGVFCDTKERLCREDRYYGSDGKPSGKVSTKYTGILFEK
jgi:hypothetical protein